jgi:putative CocE/NonD family hydrolase
MSTRTQDVWIPLSDGVRLSARVWLPVHSEPVPAVMEYLPYRKSDATAIDDSLRHPFLAQRGYAAIRVDVRGSGDSEGLLLDEYHPQEQLDALEVLRWIAAQPWCDGSVGMMGISWGGFNSLQVAAHRPPELKAIITACSTDDRYADDVHYMGGCLLGYYMLLWASVMLAYNARPPDPLVVGERWREMWLDRLQHNPWLAETWLSHPRRDEYWKQGSVCEQYAAITCPVYLVGGWQDGYTDAIFRMLEGLSCPRRALVGPWSHAWPEEGIPGPRIGFLQESVRWWDHWLKGIDTGIMDEPLVRFFMQESEPPQTFYTTRRGHWIAEADWPTPKVRPRTLTIASVGLTPGPHGETRTLTHRSAQTVGIDAGAWLPYGNPADLPGDQRCEDARSLCFTSPPLDAPLQLLGQPVAHLTVSVDRSRAFVAVRLCDVSPTGSVALITRGILNLSHRGGHEHPEPLQPHHSYEIEIPLKAIGYSIPAGHRLRLAISTAYWPWIWPTAEAATISVHTTPHTRLVLPARTPQAGDGSYDPFESATTATPLAHEILRERNPSTSIFRDVASGAVEYRLCRALYGARRLPDGLEYGDEDMTVFRVNDADPLSASAECAWRTEIGRGPWTTRIDVATSMTGNGEHYHLSARIDAYEGDTQVFTNSRSTSIPRDQ